VLQRHFVYEYAGASLRRMSMTVTPPGASTPTQSVEATFDPDSLRVHTRTANRPEQVTAMIAPAGMLVMPGSSPWSSYETAVQRLVASKSDSLSGSMLYLGAANPYGYHLRRLGRDDVEIRTDHDDVYQFRVDRAGRLLEVRPISGTQKFSVTRLDRLDLPAMTASFAAREQAGGGMGMLSPRDTVRATVAGASLWVDYGRPGKRGRTVFGEVVPFGEVWRTGANAATQFRTDKALDFGGIVVPAGFYTLWTLPSRDGWKLVVNGETGQWGTEHKADKDLYTIPMKVSALPSAVERFTIGVEPGEGGGVLNLDWDTTRASVAFTVQP
jgi:hypothetical protein